jgi:type I restriction enzyme R subunit
MKFTEKKLEQTFIELLGNEGFPHRSGDNIFRSDDEVLIEDDLKNFLLSQYKKDGLTGQEVEFIILSLKTLSSSDFI